jgi:RND superfamily putative drug exporter
VLLSLAIIFVVASLTPVSIFVLNLTTLLGLGLGVDYSLLMTSQFREEPARRCGGRLPDGRVERTAVETAVAVTVASAGRAVFFSSLTVLLGLAGLLLFEFMILRSVGAAGAIVVGLDVAAALTLLPALLTLAGPRIDALAVRRERLGTAGALGDGPPGARLRADARDPSPVRPAVLPRSVQRSRREHPPRERSVAPGEYVAGTTPGS